MSLNGVRLVVLHETCRCCGGLPGRFVAGWFLLCTVCSTQFVLMCMELMPPVGK